MLPGAHHCTDRGDVLPSERKHPCPPGGPLERAALRAVPAHPHHTQAWKNQFIHGFTPIAGNWPGQGIFYRRYFTGLNIIDFNFPTNAANAASSATMYQTHPSSYMSSSDPAVFGNQEVVVQTVQPSKTYTPKDNRKLFRDAGLTLAQELAAFYVGFVKFAKPGSSRTLTSMPRRDPGSRRRWAWRYRTSPWGRWATSAWVKHCILRDGDFNQEDITNDYPGMGNHALLPF